MGSAAGDTRVDRGYIDELQRRFGDTNFRRVERSDGMYITNPMNRSMRNDARIFKETQAKRMLRSSPLVSGDVVERLQYFSQGEDRDESRIYRLDDCVQCLQPGERYAVQNTGHATQLVQVPGFNILTDPVFGDLHGLLYPAKTRSHPDVSALPRIDVVLISHNHRDHVDSGSLRRLLEHHEREHWPQPEVLVPMGDRKLFEDLGFRGVAEVPWYTRVCVTRSVAGEESAVCFVSIPADHRSGRSGLDHHRSLVTGWVMSSEQGSVVFKYSGDTRPLSDSDQLAVDAVLWSEMRGVRDIVCLEPSGPNYTRHDMDVTHQSTSYSALLRFVEAANLARLGGGSAEEFLEKMHVVMVHHNRFELGPDRFNEGLFVLKKLLWYLDMSDAELDAELARQRGKLETGLDRERLCRCTPLVLRPVISCLPAKTSLLVRSKDFIASEIREVARKGGLGRGRMKELIAANTLFPRIGERVNDSQIAHSLFDAEAVAKYRRRAK